MLSILIPTYNHDCFLLVDELVNQVDALGIEAEIVVMDDGSTDMEKVAENSGIEDMPGCRYVVSPKNRGIAQTRNALMAEAKYDLMLFLDADVWPKSETFLRDYIAAADKADVVTGGIDYRTGEEVVCNPLRLRYGLTHEVQNAEQRSKNPFRRFNSSSFLIRRSVTEKVRFDETFDRYGHEDTIFGLALKDSGSTIYHIDNPVYHDNADSQDQYLSKVRIAIQSLNMHREELARESRLLQMYNHLDRLHLTEPVYSVFKTFRNRMEQNLLGKHPSMFVLGVYKISYLCGVMRL